MARGLGAREFDWEVILKTFLGVVAAALVVMGLSYGVRALNVVAESLRLRPPTAEKLDGCIMDAQSGPALRLACGDVTVTGLLAGVGGEARAIDTTIAVLAGADELSCTRYENRTLTCALGAGPGALDLSSALRRAGLASDTGLGDLPYSARRALALEAPRATAWREIQGWLATLTAVMVAIGAVVIESRRRRAEDEVAHAQFINGLVMWRDRLTGLLDQARDPEEWTTTAERIRSERDKFNKFVGERRYSDRYRHTLDSVEWELENTLKMLSEADAPSEKDVVNLVEDLLNAFNSNSEVEKQR